MEAIATYLNDGTPKEKGLKSILVIGANNMIIFLENLGRTLKNLLHGGGGQDERKTLSQYNVLKQDHLNNKDHRQHEK